eukprot:COSAG05_NODE_14358_length_399_cov_0.683333_1_plen_75_part_00
MGDPGRRSADTQGGYNTQGGLQYPRGGTIPKGGLTLNPNPSDLHIAGRARGSSISHMHGLVTACLVSGTWYIDA